jgi:hypothetical protein
MVLPKGIDMVSAAPLFCAGITGKSHAVWAISSRTTLSRVLFFEFMILIMTQHIMALKAATYNQINGSPSLVAAGSATLVCLPPRYDDLGF